MKVTFSINRADLLRFNLHHAAHGPLTWTMIAVLSAILATTLPAQIPLGARSVMFGLILVVITVVHFVAP